MQYVLTGGARILNWVLAAMLMTSCAGAILLFRDSVGLTASVCVLSALLLVGVLIRSPLAYLGIATLSFFGAAAALSRTDMLLGVLNLLAMMAALFVRSRLLIRSPGLVQDPGQG
jgi:hypothetical protein